MRRTAIGVVVALAMITGWFLRIGAELLDDWDALAVPVSAVAFGVFVEVIERSLDKSIKDSGSSASEVDRG